jgi:DNA-binding NarL/FixJ family response regulator
MEMALVMKVLISLREFQIIELVSIGLKNREIAEKLEITKRTVDTHMTRILAKTKTKSRTTLVINLLENQLEIYVRNKIDKEEIRQFI